MMENLKQHKFALISEQLEIEQNRQNFGITCIVNNYSMTFRTFQNAKSGDMHAYNDGSLVHID